MTRAHRTFIALYRALTITGAVILVSSFAGRPDLAIVGLALMVLGLVVRSERWRAECAVEDEWAGDCEKDGASCN